jgi:hypothetical protein
MLVDAIEVGRLDERAVATCKASAAPLLAAIDSSAGDVGRLGMTYELVDDLELGAQDGDDYVAICAFDATEIDALRDDITVYSLWQSEMHGSGVLAAW